MNHAEPSACSACICLHPRLNLSCRAAHRESRPYAITASPPEQAQSVIITVPGYWHDPLPWRIADPVSQATRGEAHHRTRAECRAGHRDRAGLIPRFPADETQHEDHVRARNLRRQSKTRGEFAGVIQPCETTTVAPTSGMMVGMPPKSIGETVKNGKNNEPGVTRAATSGAAGGLPDKIRCGTEYR